jgi:hypothetical protein
MQTSNAVQALLADDGRTKDEGSWLVNTLSTIGVDPSADASGTIADGVESCSDVAVAFKDAIKEGLRMAGSVVAEFHEEVLDVLAEAPMVRDPNNASLDTSYRTLYLT